MGAMGLYDLSRQSMFVPQFDMENSCASDVPTTDVGIESAYDTVFVLRELAVLNVGPKIVEPSQPAALPASVETFIHAYDRSSLVR